MNNKNKLLGLAVIIIAIFALAVSCDGTHVCAFGNWTERTAATCTEAAVEARTCECGEEETRISVASLALGHDYEYDPSATPPTCLTPGHGLRICKRDGCDFEENTNYDALGHSFAVTIPATCTEDSIPGTCTRDGCDIVNPEEVETALDPNWGEWTVVSITSLANVEETRTCTRACSLLGHTETRPTNLTLAQYISSQIAEPVFLPIQINLGTMTFAGENWFHILAALHTAGKNVALDLSASMRSSDGAFTTGTGFTAGTVPNGMHYIVSIILPDTTVTSIDNNAFRFLTNLTSVTIGNSVMSISQNAFASCTGLKEIVIPDSVTSIGSNAFGGCTSLTSVILPNNPNFMTISNGMFRVCTSLTSITIPNSVTSINQSAFENCTSLTEIVIPNSVTSIGTWAFQGTGLTNVTIPNSVTSIGNQAFGSCTDLTSINVDTDNPDFSSMNGVLYNKIQTTLIQAPAGISGHFVIPNSVTSIGQSAFRDCTSLTGIIIPNSVTNIVQIAFFGCTSLKEIVIPNSVTSIGNAAFQDCTGLTSVTFERLTAPSLGSSMFNNTHDTLQIFVPVGRAAAYRGEVSLSTWRNRIHSVGCDLDNPASGVNCSCQ